MVTEMRRERPRCASLMIASPRMTAVASAASWATSARLASRIAASTRDPMRRTASRMRPSSRSSASRGAGVAPPLVPAAPCRRSSSWASMWVFPAGSLMSPTSAEPAGHVVLGQLLFGIGEDLDGVALLHYIAGVILGHVEEDRLVRRPCGLLHVVGHDDDRVALLDLRHQLLDLEGRPGVECGARLVHEDDLAIARAMHSRCCWPPDNDSPDCLSLSLTSSQIAARRRLCSTSPSRSPLNPFSRGPKATLS